MVRFMKGLAIFLLIAGCIGGIVLGFAYPSVSSSSYTWDKPNTTFNVALLLVAWIGSVIMFSLLFSIGIIIELLERMVPASKPVTVFPPISMHKNIPASSKGGAFTRCTSCGEDVPKERRFCIYCGNKL